MWRRSKRGKPDGEPDRKPVHITLGRGSPTGSFTTYFTTLFYHLVSDRVLDVGPKLGGSMARRLGGFMDAWMSMRGCVDVWMCGCVDAWMRVSTYHFYIQRLPCNAPFSAKCPDDLAGWASCARDDCTYYSTICTVPELASMPLIICSSTGHRWTSSR